MSEPRKRKSRGRAKVRTRDDKASSASAALRPVPPPASNDWGRNGAKGRGDPLTTDVEYTPEELEFSLAMDRYRREKRRSFPTCREVLAVAVSLGYRKVADPQPLPDPPPRCDKKG